MGVNRRRLTIALALIVLGCLLVGASVAAAVITGPQIASAIVCGLGIVIAGAGASGVDVA